jgi:hypothetical protein
MSQGQFNFKRHVRVLFIGHAAAAWVDTSDTNIVSVADAQ